jgi:hypothetical protein
MNTIFQPTANCQNSNCLTQGVHPIRVSSPQSPTRTRQTHPNPSSSPSLIHSFTFFPNIAV